MYHGITAIVAADSKEVLMSGKCMICAQDQRIVVSKDQFMEYSRGGLIQHCFPNLTAGEREFIVSGFCEPCFDRLFQESEDDNG